MEGGKPTFCIENRIWNQDRTSHPLDFKQSQVQLAASVIPVTRSAHRGDGELGKGCLCGTELFRKIVRLILTVVRSEAVDTVRGKPRLGSICSALLPRPVRGFHHPGGLSEPLQVENSLGKPRSTPTAREPRVLAGHIDAEQGERSAGLNSGPFLSGPVMSSMQRGRTLPLPRDPSEEISPFSSLSRIPPKVNLNALGAEELLHPVCRTCVLSPE